MAKNIFPLVWVGVVLLSLLLGINVATAQMLHPTLQQNIVGENAKAIRSTLTGFSASQGDIPSYGISREDASPGVRHRLPDGADSFLLLYSLLVGGFLFFQREAFTPSVKGNMKHQ